MKIFASMIQLKCFITLNAIILHLDKKRGFPESDVCLFIYFRPEFSQWNQGHISWEEDKDAAQICRDGIRKAKAQLELNQARNMKTGQKGFYRYAAQKRKMYFPR